MVNYILSCCSTADLTVELLAKRDIHYICFHFELDGVQYADDLGQSIPFEKFYQAMADGAMTRTSMVNVDEYIAYFTPFLEAGLDVLHCTLSSGISGSYGSACIARETLLEKYPDRKLYIVDSLGASSGFGLLMDKLADLRDEGRTIDEVRNWAEANKLKAHHWFFSTDLKYYIRGGRVSKAAGTVGTILGICPLLNVDYLGRLISREKPRGKKRAVEAAVQKMVEHAQNGADYDGACFISHSASLPEAQAVAGLVEQKFPKLKGKIKIFYIGTTIGAHTGPGTVALFFWGDDRVD